MLAAFRFSFLMCVLVCVSRVSSVFIFFFFKHMKEDKTEPERTQEKRETNQKPPNTGLCQGWSEKARF